MPSGKVKPSSRSIAQPSTDDMIFPPAILTELCPSTEALGSFCNHIEEYIVRLVSHLIFLKGQNKIVRESIVAIADAAGSSASTGTVNTTDACRALRSFTGLKIPDLTSITRLPQVAVVSEVSTSVHATPELSSISPTMRAMMEIETASPMGVVPMKKRAGSVIADQLPPKVPKKRGRPRKNPLPENS